MTERVPQDQKPNPIDDENAGSQRYINPFARLSEPFRKQLLEIIESVRSEREIQIEEGYHQDGTAD